jgi:hypothetical protein
MINRIGVSMSTNKTPTLQQCQNSILDSQGKYETDQLLSGLHN